MGRGVLVFFYKRRQRKGLSQLFLTAHPRKTVKQSGKIEEISKVTAFLSWAG